MVERVNNQTEVPMSFYKERYRSLAVQDICRRCQAEFDEKAGAFRLTMLSVPLLVSWPEYELTVEKSGPLDKIIASSYSQMLIIRYLIEGGAAPLTDKFLTYREMPWGDVYDANFQGRCIKRLAHSFGNRPDSFREATERLGGSKLGFGDASYELQWFENLRARLIIWEGDDEFPPSSQILFSDNTVVAFTAEDRAAVGDLLINALKAFSN